MKYTACMLTALILVFAASAQNTDFTGKWFINKEKCDFGKLSPNSAGVEIRVDQQKDSISIWRKQLYASGDVSQYTETMNFDGKTTENALNGSVKKTSFVKWSNDGKTLVEASTYSNGGAGRETWTLSDDGKVLTIERISVVNGEDMPVKYVYDKK